MSEPIIWELESHPNNQSSKPIWYTNSRSFNMRLWLRSFSVGRFEFFFLGFFELIVTRTSRWFWLFLKANVENSWVSFHSEVAKNLKSKVMWQKTRWGLMMISWYPQHHLQKNLEHQNQNTHSMAKIIHPKVVLFRKIPHLQNELRNPAWLGILEVAWLQPLCHRGSFPPCPPVFFGTKTIVEYPPGYYNIPPGEKENHLQECL